jgi:UDP-N-acetylmuramoylalanine--D-glutamate ligase
MNKSKTKPTLVVGLGASGRAACRFLAKRGVSVIAVDFSQAEPLQAVKRELETLGVEVHLGEESLPTKVANVVVSPGVHLEKLAPFIDKGVPIIGELELGAREIQVPYIAVTGTNGKSTVVTNLERGFELAGLEARAIGNLGTPITEWVDSGEQCQAVVLEVSSYQLETIDSFHPKVAVILNVAPDHLARHHSMDGYLAAKARICENQTIDDALLLHKDLVQYPELQKTRGRLYWYGRDLSPSLDGLSLAGNQLRWTGAGPSWTQEISMEGLLAHEIDNLLAVVAGLHLMGVSKEDSLRIVDSPLRLPHRLEPIATVREVAFINDSKATNAHAAIAALRSVEGTVVWLVGGLSKGEDLSELAETAREVGVRYAICFGADRAQFAEALIEKVPHEQATGLRAAFERAVVVASPGSKVLLSPAGASFDEFKSFEDRGDRFRQWVLDYKERAA